MNKLTIIRDIEGPPGGWKFLVPETGVTVKGDYAKTIRAKVAAHLTANGLPAIPKDEFEDALCRQNPHGMPWCGKPPTPQPKDTGVLTKGVVLRALRTVIGLVRDRKFVERAEAERRMAICKTCPFITDIGLGCRAGCSDELREMDKILGKHPDGIEPVCGKCLCFLRPKVWLLNETMDRAEANDRPDYWEEGCWRLGH